MKIVAFKTVYVSETLLTVYFLLTYCTHIHLLIESHLHRLISKAVFFYSNSFLTKHRVSLHCLILHGTLCINDDKHVNVVFKNLCVQYIQNYIYLRKELLILNSSGVDLIREDVSLCLGYASCMTFWFPQYTCRNRCLIWLLSRGFLQWALREIVLGPLPWWNQFWVLKNTLMFLWWTAFCEYIHSVTIWFSL